jgi:NitT/TauT family transport system permease protein
MSLALINAKPGRSATLMLSWMLFAAGIAGYFYVSHSRHADNPEDRVMPTVAQMAKGMFDAVMHPAEEDEATAENAPLLRRIASSMLWKDTVATARRFAYSMLL